MNIKRLLPILLFGIVLTFTMCSKDDDDSNAPTYVGKWHTNAFEFGAVNVVMNFEFMENSFETIINPEGATIPLLGVKGDVIPSANNNLAISITDLGSVNKTTGALDWYNRVDDEQMFNGIYLSTVSAFMPKDFDATYEIEGSQMDLIIPVANDTIVLFR